MGLLKRDKNAILVTREQMQAYKVKAEIKKALDELEEEERIVTEEEVSEAVAKAIGYKFKKLEEIVRKEKRHTCSQCGAPLKDGKCEYCGTNYN